jgi:hypothetical protein
MGLAHLAQQQADIAPASSPDTSSLANFPMSG